jgi:hypothetical protein
MNFLYGHSVREPRGWAPLLGTLKFKKALVTGPTGETARAHLPGTLRDGCLHSVPVGEPGEGVCLLGTSRISWRALAMEHQLYGRSVTGTWRWGSFAGGPEGYERMGISHGSSVGQPVVGSSTG